MHMADWSTDSPGGDEQVAVRWVRPTQRHIKKNI